MNGKIITLNDSNIIAKLKFDYPQQVIFHSDVDAESVMSAGIAYGKEIVCMCCGAVVPLDEADFLQYDPEVWCNEGDELMEDLREAFIEE